MHIMVIWVHLCAVWRSSGSFRFVGFTQALPRGRWVHSGAPWGSLGSFRRALRSGGFIRACPRRRDVHSVWLTSFGRAF